jgi:hypothetical protein
MQKKQRFEGLIPVKAVALSIKNVSEVFGRLGKNVTLCPSGSQLFGMYRRCEMRTHRLKISLIAALAFFSPLVQAQLIDNNQAPNTAKAGINKSLANEIGPGRGDLMTPNSSLFIINRDPFRSVRRGRQIFQRKFLRAQGQGPANNDGTGNINLTGGIGAGLSDSCAGCHGRPRGSAGAGGDVATRPDSRDAPHLFGLGLKEMLADEMTSDMRAIRAGAIADAKKTGQAVTR